MTEPQTAPLKFADVKAGDRLVADDGFTCLRHDEVVTVAACANGLYVPCTSGSHYLDGQEGDDGALIGLRRAP
jgi:hypothetical protein